MLWINEEKKRFYHVKVITDLLGDTIIIKDSGSLVTSMGKRMIDVARSSDEVKQIISSITKRRKLRGYRKSKKKMRI